MASLLLQHLVVKRDSMAALVRLVALGTMLVTEIACGPAATSTAGFGQPCSKDDDCAGKLICPKDGPAPGLCSMTCANDQTCKGRFGAGSHCREHACVQTCEGADGCSAGADCKSPLAGHCGRTTTTTTAAWSCKGTEDTSGWCHCSAGSDAGSSCAAAFASPALACCRRGGDLPDPDTWDRCNCVMRWAFDSYFTCDGILSGQLKYGSWVERCPPTP